MGAGSNGIIFDDLEWPITRFSTSRHLWSRISQKLCVLGTNLFKSTNSKPYTIDRMVPLSITLSDLLPRFQGQDITWSRISEKTTRLKDKVTITQEEAIPNIWNVTMFGDLDWALNASRGFASISWASCFVLCMLFLLSVCLSVSLYLKCKCAHELQIQTGY